MIFKRMRDWVRERIVLGWGDDKIKRRGNNLRVFFFILESGVDE